MKINPVLARGLKLAVLGEMVATLFNTSIVLPVSSMMVSEARAESTPEMPLALVPVFVAMAIGVLLYVRKQTVLAARF